MISKLNLQHILFLDIETVPQFEKWDETSSEVQELYEEKTKYQRKEVYTAEEFYDKAGIWAEFGQIICISVGYFTNEKEENKFRVTSFASSNEKQLLLEFKQLLDTYFNAPKYLLCAHNGKEFDFPYIARRMVINRIPLPKKLNLFGKKPWEVPHLDTLELWKFGDYKHYTSLKLLTHILEIPSPKEDIDGSEVKNIYYQEKDIERIKAYCERDTIAVAQVLLRFLNLPLVKSHNIIKV